MFQYTALRPYCCAGTKTLSQNVYRMNSPSIDCYIWERTITVKNGSCDHILIVATRAHTFLKEKKERNNPTIFLLQAKKHNADIIFQ
jgi:hypothetical protein